ncbi:MAG: metallophosphoesterase [Pirellulales bacterium]|nr:metallophosphoesterase [Pirellulales bacterium]
MSELLDLLMFLALLIGHAAIWIHVGNWIHATSLHYRVVKAISLAMRLIMIVGASAMLIWLVWRRVPEVPFFGMFHWRSMLSSPHIAYFWLCLAVTLGPVAAAAWRRLTFRTPDELLANHAESIAFSQVEFSGATLAGSLVKLPGNQSVQLQISEKRLRIDKLDHRLNGLRIAHLSDLHFTGRIRKEYFERVIAFTQQSRPDLIVIAGDLIDRNACIDWIPEVLGKLSAPLGVFAVLGNHDLRVEVPRLRRAIVEAGIELISDRWVSLKHSGAPLILAGNELPWFSPAANMDDAPQEIDGFRPLRILLSHSPDQLAWAKRRGFDLMVAGHTHGGQIRLPIWGPLVSPSRHGTKYASGTFFESPTLLHVSRGISGKLPLRWNCPPELPILILETGRSSDDS